MNTEILGVILQWVALVVLCYPLGRYIAKVYRGERTWLDFMAPLERGIYKVCSIDPDEDMDWKKFLKALLMVNLFWFFWGMLLLVFQGYLCCSAARAGCRSTPTATPTRPPTWRSTPASRSWSTATCSITAARRVSPILRSCSSSCSSSSSPRPAAWRLWPAS